MKMAENKKTEAKKPVEKTAKPAKAEENKAVAEKAPKAKKANKKEEVTKAEAKKPMPTEARATATNVRVTPRKARLVLDMIRGKNVNEAEAILRLTPRGACEPVLKVLLSATANATHNLDLKKENLYVSECYATDDVRMKRMLPRAKGRGDIIQKRTCNITVVVAEKE